MIARAITQIFVVCLALLGGCQRSAPAAQNQQAAPFNNSVAVSHISQERPAFALTEIDVEDLLAKINASWQSPISTSEHEDSLTNGRSKMLLYRGHSADLFIMPDGNVWRIRVYIGMGDRCGSKIEVKKVAASLAGLISPGFDGSTFAAGTGSTGITEAETPNAYITSSDGCVLSVTATARAHGDVLGRPVN